jgi:hypothetical protein
MLCHFGYMLCGGQQAYIHPDWLNAGSSISGVFDVVVGAASSSKTAGRGGLLY